jgi:hypothetical protein
MQERVYVEWKKAQVKETVFSNTHLVIDSSSSI